MFQPGTRACVLVLLVAFHGFSEEKKLAEKVVWDGKAPEGKTWAKLGPGGGLEVSKGAGLEARWQGLVLTIKGDGWRGAGLNWKGWYPPDACDDVSRYTALVFHIRQETKVADADLTVHLVDN